MRCSSLSVSYSQTEFPGWPLVPTWAGIWACSMPCIGDWDGDWEKLTLDEAHHATTGFTNIGIELRFGALLPIM